MEIVFNPSLFLALWGIPSAIILFASHLRQEDERLYVLLQAAEKENDLAARDVSKARKNIEQSISNDDLPGPWIKLYNDCIEAYHLELRYEMIQDFLAENDPSDVPVLPLLGANHFMDIIEDGAKEAYDPIYRAMAIRMKPFMQSVDKPRNSEEPMG